MTAGNNTGLPPSVFREAGEGLTSPLRDSKYYFEDGSITFCVKDVHISILKLQSKDFMDKIDVCPANMDAQSKGCTHVEVPVIVADCRPSQFRNLMEIVYCPPPNKLALIQSVTSDESAWHNFVFYSDVAILSRRLGMLRLERWAKKVLRKLVRTAMRKVADGIPLYDNDSSEVEDEGSVDTDESVEELTGEMQGCEVGDRDRAGDSVNDCTNDSAFNGQEPDERNDQLVPAKDYSVFRLIEAIWYAQEASETTLLHRLRGIFCYYAYDLPTHVLVSLFKISDLRERDPSLFGFLFLMLLGQGNTSWEQDMFSKADRMAFFSAQSYLTPLPNSLGTPLQAPLFKRPKSSKSFAARLLSDSKQSSCADSCCEDAFVYWDKEFDGKYYGQICSSRPLAGVLALAYIPVQRLNFADGINGSKCKHNCHTDILGTLDQDIQDVYAQISEYYRPII